MGEAKRRGTREQRVASALERLLEEEDLAEEELALFDADFPMMLFGYPQEAAPFVSDLEPVCMISNITVKNQADISAALGVHLQLGDWFVSSGSHENSILTGPFDSMESALDFGRTEYGVFRFLSYE